MTDRTYQIYGIEFGPIQFEGSASSYSAAIDLHAADVGLGETTIGAFAAGCWGIIVGDTFTAAAYVSQADRADLPGTARFRVSRESDGGIEFDNEARSFSDAIDQMSAEHGRTANDIYADGYTGVLVHHEFRPGDYVPVADRIAA